MLQEAQVAELRRIYGELGGIEVAKSRYMENPDDSFQELVSSTGYKKGLNQKWFEHLVRENNVPQYLRDYKARIEANFARGIDVRIEQNDIREVLLYEIPKLQCHRAQYVAGRGRRVFTGQTEQAGSNLNILID